MIKRNIDEFYRGWFIGNFEPSLLKTDQFEVSILKHAQGEHWPKHYHAIATEYNVLLKGSMKINGELMTEGDVFVIEPGEAAEPEFLEDCTLVCVKTPSLPGDKYEVL
jgi:quercetin dioxygenase-like cupin family protein